MSTYASSFPSAPAQAPVVSSTGNFIMVGATRAPAGTASPSDPRARMSTGSLDQRVPPSPLRRVSIRTEGTLTSPMTPWHAAYGDHANTRQAGQAALVGSAQGMRASPLVWSVVEAPLDPPDARSAPLAAATGPATSWAVGAPALAYRQGLADTPLNHSFAESPRPSEHGEDESTTAPVWPRAAVPAATARPPLPLPSPSAVRAVPPPAETLIGSAPPSPSSPPPAPVSLASLTWSAATIAPGPLGPLWTVRRQAPPLSASTEARAEKDEASTSSDAMRVAELERLSLQRELRALRRQLDAARAATEVVRCESLASAEATVEDLVRRRREDERQRRQQFQATLDTLREENRELTAALDAARRAAAMGLQRPLNTSGTTLAPAAVLSSTLEAEWARRLDEVEAYWRERLRTAERHWTQEMDTQLAAQKRDHQQLRLAQRTIAEAQEQLRHAEAEHMYVTEQVERRLGMPLAALLDESHVPEKVRRLQLATASATDVVDADGAEPSWTSVPQLVQEVRALRAGAVAHQHRETALLAQLDGYSEEAARLQLTLEGEAQKLRRELETERRRNADLVQLYGGQVQSLHAQLKDAVREKKELVDALRSLR